MKSFNNEINPNVSALNIPIIHANMQRIQNIIRNTIISIQKYKSHELFSNSESSMCISTLNDLYDSAFGLSQVLYSDNIENKSENLVKISELSTKINDKMELIISGFGTQHFDDLLYVAFGLDVDFIPSSKFDIEMRAKFDIIRQYIHPIGYKIIKASLRKKPQDRTRICYNKLIDEIYVMESFPSIECFDIDISTRLFFQKVYGIQVVIHTPNKSIIVYGIIDNIDLMFVNDEYVNSRRNDMIQSAADSEASASYDKEIIQRMMDTFTIKDILIYGNGDILKKYAYIQLLVNSVKTTKLEATVKKFTASSLFIKRSMLIELLIHNKDCKIQYITYILYDLISPNPVCETESNEQVLIYDSFPWKVKSYFKLAMRHTVNYTQEMINKCDMNRISLEQQLFMLNVPENVKEKAFVKLKEIKNKSDESCTKAKQYLDGLLRIPFGVYRHEEWLDMNIQLNTDFKHTITLCEEMVPNVDHHMDKKNRYTNLEIYRYMNDVTPKIDHFINESMLKHIDNFTAKQAADIIQQLHSRLDNSCVIANTKKTAKPEKPIKSKSKKDNISQIRELAPNMSIETQLYILEMMDPALHIENTYKGMENINKQLHHSKTQLDKIVQVLDESIYAHSYAKNQILKIVSQWISGESSGYCFGFEGSPGIGKTSLAKNGLAKCLVSENGETRPFSFISLGGSCNGSTLEGHSYTYVNSIWGRIADILMESKCMNPIIYIDELDKVSKSENGKEIIGILTHLIDSTQNDTFQDKYFSGIHLDLSKALFIFSYNDVDQIDRVLLDRIHRIKFDNLTLSDKIVIVREHILPEINKKMGFENIVELTPQIVEFIIENYTMESGVRKLKEVLFDLYGEINIEMLKCDDNHIREIPIVITIADLETRYLKKYHKHTHIRANSEPAVGVINGLWANTLGKGGIIQIECVFFPSPTLLEFKLTGMQGDVMKESMNVAKSLAWKLTPQLTKTELVSEFEKTKSQGIHIHCPEGAVNKDGPSAGTAITIALYSLFNNRPIKNEVAITGEITLQGKITAIGGLDSKIVGGIKAGIKKFLYPSENHPDFLKFIEKHGEIPTIEFVQVSNIEDVFTHVFV
jgi:ATP-dependent Lon protease